MLKVTEEYKTFKDGNIMGDDQIEGTNFLLQRKSALLSFQTGLGKCFAKDTEILMYNGTVKKVQDIQVGDIIMGWDSTPRTVSSLAHGYEEMYEIKQDKKGSYIVNESHILSLKMTGIGKGGYTRKDGSYERDHTVDCYGVKYYSGDICNISVRDYLICSDRFKHLVKGFAMPAYFPDGYTPINAYFLGLWLGDGSSYGTTIYNVDKEIPIFLRAYAKQLGMILKEEWQVATRKEFFRKDGTPSEVGAYTLIAENGMPNPIRNYLMKEMRNGKHIPYFYKYNSEKVRLHVLAGLIDTDGYYNGLKEYEILTKFKELADDIVFVARSLGFAARYTVSHNTKYDKDYYRCVINGNEVYKIPVQISRKKAVKKDTGNKDCKMFNIEVVPVGYGEYFGFTLEGPDRMFLLGDFSVAHNTTTALVASKILLDNFESARIVISCPVKALKAWKRDLFGKLGIPKDDVSIYATNEFRDIRTAKYFIFTDTNLEKYIEAVEELYADGYKIVFLIDEAHKLQDKKSKVYETCKKVRDMSTLTYSISATPILNDLDGLYNIVDFVCPRFLGSKTNFDNRYTKWHLEDIYVKGGHGTKKKVKVLDGYQHLDELNEKLKQVMIIRSKEYNLKFIEVSRELTDEEMSVYERVSSGFVTQSRSKDDERNFSKRMHDLQRFLDRAYEGDDSIKELVEKYNANTYSTKEEMLIEALKNALDKKYSIIVYSDYKDTIKRLHSVLKGRKKELGLNNIYEITGNINIKERERVEDRISPGDVVLISSAGSESIDLQRCSCLIYYDIPFSIKVIVQTLGRICRRNTEHDTQYVVIPYTKGTIDEYKFLMFKQHIDLVKKSVGIANDIPFEMMTVDTNTMRDLRNKLLWKYKGDTEGKRKRKEKKQLKALIRICNVEESKTEISNNKFLIEPIDYELDSDLKAVNALCPDSDVYDKYIKGEIPFTVLRAKYVDFLNSEDGIKLLKGLIAGVRKTGDLILVGNTDIPNILKDKVLEVYDIM